MAFVVKMLQHLLHKCWLDNFSWCTRFLGWPGKRWYVEPSQANQLPVPLLYECQPTTKTMSACEASDDDDFNQYAPGHMPMPDFEALARYIQNRASHRVGAVTTETRHFREFFGTSALIVEKVWELLERDSLLPEGGRPKHLLWALHL